MLENRRGKAMLGRWSLLSSLRRITDALLAVFVLGLLGMSLIRAIWRPKEVNFYENRYANQLPEFSVSTVRIGEYQDKVESALNDQVYLAQTLKSAYNELENSVLMWQICRIAAQNPDRYVQFRSLLLFGGNHLCYYTRTLSDQESALKEFGDKWNRIFAAHPELNFYAFFVEKETEINLRTGEKNGVSDAAMAYLALPETQKHIERVENFADFSRRFYRTDHHWNYLGSYQGYLSALALLGVNDVPAEPMETGEFGNFSGSKSLTLGSDVFEEPFLAYRFLLPEMKITINGETAADYGAQEEYFASPGTAAVGYGAFYGGDNGEVVFETEYAERENLLVLGESFDNAILKLLASHFHKTCSIDLRDYETAMGKPFDFGAYVKAHNISKVLLIGNVDFYTGPDTFTVEG